MWTWISEKSIIKHPSWSSMYSIIKNVYLITQILPLFERNFFNKKFYLKKWRGLETYQLFLFTEVCFSISELYFHIKVVWKRFSSEQSVSVGPT